MILQFLFTTSEKDFLEDFIFHSYLFKERMTFDLIIISFDEGKEVLLSDDLKFTSKFNSHLDKYKKNDQQSRIGFCFVKFSF